MDDFPVRAGFEDVDKIMKHAGGISPARMNQLLGECNCIEVKRMFLRFAERHNHAWLDQIDIDAAGSGGRGQTNAWTHSTTQQCGGTPVPAHSSCALKERRGNHAHGVEQGMTFYTSK